MKLVNLGCGGRYLDGWINLDQFPAGKNVLTFDAHSGLPFEESSIDVVYTSHLLEHLPSDTMKALLKEMYRVLMPQGIVRIVIPDLERSVRGYLECLEKVREQKTSLAKENYHWSVIELIDQFVRDQPGGKMLEYWNRNDLINEEYLITRSGEEFCCHKGKSVPDARTENQNQERSRIRKARFWILQKLLGIPVTPRDIDFLRVRQMGEHHQWMYDDWSLSELLQDTGFQSIQRTDAFHSRIPDWEKHNWLDVENGKTRKPDSLFMEALK